MGQKLDDLVVQNLLNAFLYCKRLNAKRFDRIPTFFPALQKDRSSIMRPQILPYRQLAMIPGAFSDTELSSG